MSGEAKNKSEQTNSGVSQDEFNKVQTQNTDLRKKIESLEKELEDKSTALESQKEAGESMSKENSDLKEQIVELEGRAKKMKKNSSIKPKSGKKFSWTAKFKEEATSKGK